jgi:hypothetical protein
MSSDKLKLLLTELEAEVLHAALELYLQAQPVPVDRRFEYRYRAARTVLESLRQGNREFGTLPRGDDDEGGLSDEQRSERRPFQERVED